MMRRWMRGAFLGLLVAVGGCGGGVLPSGVASAVQSTFTVLRDVRAILCTTKLDPLLGNPREGQAVYAALPGADAGSDASTVSDD